MSWLCAVRSIGWVQVVGGRMGVIGRLSGVSGGGVRTWPVDMRQQTTLTLLVPLVLHLPPLLSLLSLPPLVLLLTVHCLLLLVSFTGLAYLASSDGVQYSLSSAECLHTELLQVVVSE